MFDIRDEPHSAYWQLKYDDTIFDDLFYRHMHNNLELHLIIRGGGVFSIDANEAEVSEYDLIIVPPHCYHVLNVDKSRPYERMVFNFPVDYYNIDLSKITSKPTLVNLSSHHEIMSNFKKIYEYSNSLNEDDFKKIIHLYTQIILIQLINTEFDNGMSKSVNHLTASVLRYIDDHLFGELNVKVIAGALYVSKSHLQNTFYKSMKIGLKAYIIQRKMDKAQTLINEGVRALDVAKKLGYKTYSTFYKSYVKIYGVPPRGGKKL